MTIYEQLALPFPKKDIEWRLNKSGKYNGNFWATCLAYISARAVMDRLDSVLGPNGWHTSYSEMAAGVICHLSIRGDNGEWVSKSDGSDFPKFEAFKGGLSSALKRAASAWGVGRYLYNLDEGKALICDRNAIGAMWAKTKEGESFYWLPPELPAWALPENERQEQAKSRANEPLSDTFARVKNYAPQASDDQMRRAQAIVNDLNQKTQLGLKVTGVENEGDGSYVIKFGKHKGKTLNQVGSEEVESYTNYLKGSGKSLSNEASDFIKQASVFLNSIGGTKRDRKEQIENEAFANGFGEPPEFETEVIPF